MPENYITQEIIIPRVYEEVPPCVVEQCLSVFEAWFKENHGKARKPDRIGFTKEYIQTVATGSWKIEEDNDKNQNQESA